MEKFNIKSFNPCPEAVVFYDKYNSFKEAWSNCHRGDWMLWISKTLNVDIRILTLAKGKCAETVIYLMKDERSRNAVKAAIDFGMMKIDIDELSVSASAASAAYNAAYASAVAANAFGAVDAANAFGDAVDCAVAYVAVTYYDASAARKENQKQTADICREILTKEVMNKIKDYE